jgi:uncharacterized membrane protein YhaH (DUF805 family)
MNDYLNVVRNNYANFSGRARRREFWMFTLVNTIVLVVLAALMGVGFALSDTDLSSISPLVYVSIGLLSIYGLATLVPTLAVSVRRLHDAGYSGWLELLEFVGLRVVVLIFHIMDSQPGTNKWGPNPKGLAAPANAF